MTFQGVKNDVATVPTVTLSARFTDAAEMLVASLVSFTGGLIPVASITQFTLESMFAQGLSKGPPANGVMTSLKQSEHVPECGGDGAEGHRSRGHGVGGAGVSRGVRRGAADKSNVAPLCAGCHKLLTASDLQPLPPPRPRKQRQGQGQRQGQALCPEAPLVLECFGCHRCFHARCHRIWVAQHQRQSPNPQQTHLESQREGAQRGGNGSRQQTQLGRDGGGDNGSDSDMWFHCDACRQVHRALQRLCRAGDILCERPMGRTGSAPISDSAAESDDNQQLAMRLYDCRNLGLATSAGLRRVHSVLRQEFGYSLNDLRQFDFAAMLTRVGRSGRGGAPYAWGQGKGHHACSDADTSAGLQMHVTHRVTGDPQQQ
ncbi:hypothetical protein VaNZ11_013922 [Volvox africanus]|uniref:Zinc finger PHD-type domain-containing protein n=1 Tax=Volvox africanus TaxID=51714 RepID=A0ABQ5SJH0_9CHLO|nr:hypothetical protein VaNZ11_013922 [Volvox africanus]